MITYKNRYLDNFLTLGSMGEGSF
uniref:Uncharacterized protein n=1 Tax=Arundo donax TaxID=35708 RepID=A0A0A9CDA6_ARUDO